ncbi:hypothetical protein BCUN_1862 [Bifidobacterium cuniculi]|uniref:Uncharacterized protein n=1 Tax=Bifidobacterium cuniculi TaxID=1688 RepID=A0A087AFG4_9BIFI|nr:hypothetical protein BCUN_1862 [Bifidobacterium cuniculi]
MESPGSITGKPRFNNVRDTSKPPTVAVRDRESNTNGVPYTGWEHCNHSPVPSTTKSTPFGIGPFTVNTGYARDEPSLRKVTWLGRSTLSVRIYVNGYRSPVTPASVSANTDVELFASPVHHVNNPGPYDKPDPSPSTPCASICPE